MTYSAAYLSQWALLTDPIGPSRKVVRVIPAPTLWTRYQWVCELECGHHSALPSPDDEYPVGKTTNCAQCRATRERLER